MVPGLQIRNYIDDPTLRLKMGEDGRRRDTGWVRSICVHSTKGIPSIVGKPGPGNVPQVFLPGLAPVGNNDERVARYWSHDPTPAGAHLVVDHDGSIVQTADLLLEVAYHAGSSNAPSIGLEVYQGAKAEFYEWQLDVVVVLIDAITWLMTEVFNSSIQRQYHAPYRAYHPVARLTGGAASYVGIYGHRDQTDARGPGDPGDWLAPRLSAAGYEAFNFEKSADLDAWKDRQANLGITPDGIPGPKTAAALRAATKKALWVSRPIDEALRAQIVKATIRSIAPTVPLAAPPASVPEVDPTPRTEDETVKIPAPEKTPEKKAPKKRRRK